ncbi:protein NLRC3-like isoform X1 [Anguilla anguilla]|uniref:protein NLRC3-like isoform X1 n=1 Tax=Anguilla anguilla TaxID=7936 RepID=UPI0015A9C294|nr:protein NLRC3-like isoform X1 [Anguilla anguilla]
MSQKRKDRSADFESSLSEMSETSSGMLSSKRKKSMKSTDSMSHPVNFGGDFSGDKRIQLERAVSPVPSHLSMKSTDSMFHPVNFGGDSSGDKRIQLERAVSPVPSHLSMKSTDSMFHPVNFEGDFSGDKRIQLERAVSPVPSHLSMKSTDSMFHPVNFGGDSSGDKRIQLERAVSPVPSHLSMKSTDSMFHPVNFEGDFSGDKRAQWSTGFCSQVEMRDRSNGSTIAKKSQKDLDGSLEKDHQKNESIFRDQQTLRTNLKKKFECIFEGFERQGRSALFNEIFTELYITEGGSGDINNEHEVRQIEAISKRQMAQETVIDCNDIFKPLPGQIGPIRIVLTKGIAGIGKTYSVHKFILDWAEGKANPDVNFIFILPFRDLNLMAERKFSLMQLLQHYFPELKEIENVANDDVKKVLIFDGLDECRLPLDFQHNEICSDVTESTSVDMLLTNLIKGNLLPSALLWITSRPAAANQIASVCIDRVTEVRGFNNPQKEEYFRKRIGDPNMARRVISHIKSSRSLYIMCHIPIFCWISTSVLETLLSEAHNGELPTNLTELYTHFLLIQTNVKNQKYDGTSQTNPKMMLESDAEIILKLGQLAFKQLEKGNLIFYVEDLRECGIDVPKASVFSGVFTEIFKEEFGLHQEKVYCFVHLSVQEYMAALFVFHSCVTEKRNILAPETPQSQDVSIQLFELYKNAVDQALESRNGHLDLFLRFLLGLSSDTNQTLLGGFLKQKISISKNIEETVAYIKKKIRAESSAERTINLFHCLNELKANSLVEEIQTSLRSGTLSDKRLDPHQCSALAFVLLMSEDVFDEFDLKTYNTSAVGQERLIPVIKYSRKAILDRCSLTEKSCRSVALALQSVPSHLQELNLSHNNLGDSGMELLYPGLISPNCKLQSLSLCNSDFGDTGVKLLCEYLSSKNCKLQRLDLCNNNLGDLRLEPLFSVLASENCTLQSLELSSCQLTERDCVSLAPALCSNTSHLRELDLRNNRLGDSGMRQLSAGLGDPNCKLEKLVVSHCDLTGDCCDVLALVLRLPHSELRDLELSDNDLQDSGVKALCTGLEDQQCKLQSLRLSGCRVTEKGCIDLATAVRSNPSQLRVLDLTYNHPGESGVRALSAGMEDPSCALETLLTDHGGESRNKPGLRKYACQLTLDPNTTNRNLCLSEGDRTMELATEEQPYPDHPERFDPSPQVLCREGLSGRCYWEVEWKGRGADIGVAYKSISRKGLGKECELGQNENSWILYYNKFQYSACHRDKNTNIPASPFPSHRVGVYLDWSAGTLSFYSISSDSVIPLHVFFTKFTEPLYPGFYVWPDSSVSLCQL